MTLPYTQTQWNLAPLFPAVESPEVLQAVDELKAQVNAFEANRSRLSQEISASEFFEIVHTQ